jgi:hypothetical protein
MICRFASAAFILTVALPLSAQERVPSGQRVELSEARVEIFNAVGTVKLRRASGSAVTITATAQGSDAGQLAFETDHDGALGRFRVVFPDVNRIGIPSELGGYGSSDLDLRRDGTFAGNNWGHGSHRVRVGGSSGLQAWAALEIGIPDGADVKVHLAVGHADADGVNAHITMDTWSAKAEATNIAGDWLFDTGSGNVTVRGMHGTLRADTGSGDVVLSELSGGDLFDADTGSGSVEATDVQVDRFRFDTGSGDVRVSNLIAERGLVDTGSGDANLAYSGGTIDDLSIDTGSGNVRLTLPPGVDARLSIDTSSGDAEVQRSDAVFERRGGDDTELRFGQGRGRIRIDTGSGDVEIQ